MTGALFKNYFFSLPSNVRMYAYGYWYNKMEEKEEIEEYRAGGRIKYRLNLKIKGILLFQLSSSRLYYIL